MESAGKHRNDKIIEESSLDLFLWSPIKSKLNLHKSSPVKTYFLLREQSIVELPKRWVNYTDWLLAELYFNPGPAQSPPGLGWICYNF